MKNIMKDLDHYAAAFQSYLKAPLRNPEQEVALLSPTVEMIQSLRKVRVLTCAWVSEESGDDTKTESEKTSWEITFWCHLTKASLVSTELLPARGRGGILLKGTLYLGFHSSGRRGCLLTERGALIPLWFPPGGCCPDVGQWHLQQQAGDVQDVEGLLRPDHHHQQSRGLHLLRRAQEVIDGQGLTTFPDHPLPSLSNQVQSNTASERWSGISYHGRGLSLPCDETKKRKGNTALPIYDVFIICIYLKCYLIKRHFKMQKQLVGFI